MWLRICEFAVLGKYCENKGMQNITILQLHSSPVTIRNHMNALSRWPSKVASPRALNSLLAIQFSVSSLFQGSFQAGRVIFHPFWETTLMRNQASHIVLQINTFACLMHTGNIIMRVASQTGGGGTPPAYSIPNNKSMSWKTYEGGSLKSKKHWQQRYTTMLPTSDYGQQNMWPCTRKTAVFEMLIPTLKQSNEQCDKLFEDQHFIIKAKLNIIWIVL